MKWDFSKEHNDMTNIQLVEWYNNEMMSFTNNPLYTKCFGSTTNWTSHQQHLSPWLIEMWTFTFTRYFSHLSADTDLPIFLSNLTWRSTSNFGTDEGIDSVKNKHLERTDSWRRMIAEKLKRNGAPKYMSQQKLQ